MHSSSFRFSSSSDGLSVQAYRWSPPAPRAVVVIAHGAAEHALRYQRFAAALAGAGLATVALDHRGHGQSPGPAGLGDFGVGGWDALVADLRQLIALAHEADPALPVVLLGHSMGSFAAQQLAFDHSHAIAALVLSGSTAWERLTTAPTRPPPWTPNAAFEPARTPYDWLSRDHAEVDRYIADPLCGFEAQTGRSPGGGMKLHPLSDPDAIAKLRPDLPVLLVAGDDDPLNRKLAGLQLLEQRWRAAGVARIDTRYYPGGRHEMLNEINREQVTQDIVAWLLAVLDHAS